jgi:hypothetical protein
MVLDEAVLQRARRPRVARRTATEPSVGMSAEEWQTPVDLGGGELAVPKITASALGPCRIALC